MDPPGGQQGSAGEEQAEPLAKTLAGPSPGSSKPQNSTWLLLNFAFGYTQLGTLR